MEPLSSSPKISLALFCFGIKTPMDVVSHLPRRYDSFLLTPRKNIYADKERLVKEGKVVGRVKIVRFSSRSLTSFYFEATTGEGFRVEAWNRPYLASSLKEGEIYTISGLYEAKRGTVALVSLLKGEIPPSKAIKPIYELPAAVPNYVYARIVKKCLLSVKDEVPDVIPPEFKMKYRLLGRYEAFEKAHNPTDEEDIREGLRTLKYEEALIFSVKTALIRGENKALRKNDSPIDREAVKDFIRHLPYSLSLDQKKALGECIVDMDKGSIMYRLLQGDVGTGKTLVASLCCYANWTRGLQSAILAPTDSLARQHFDTLSKLFASSKLKITLLVGSLSPEERKAALQEIAEGEASIVVGTHALFSKDVEYYSLGFVVIDEQQKFGVNQRTLLLGKGDNADLLLMSATPIPRTLALTVYGDLDISSLYMFPQGKRKVATKTVSSEDPSLSKSIAASLSSSHRVYVVAPEIEDKGDEEASVKAVYAFYKRRYGDKVTMMHGKMDEESNQVAFLAFKSGLCPILVATSLIEVGIDVKEANLMIIYSPAHFSLSSLHQLRGRIGRDGSQATCFLVGDGDEEENEKLKVLSTSDDGFKIAEEDLRLRGPGEVSGLRQSGLPSFLVANLVNDFKVFECARNDASIILSRKDDKDFAKILKIAAKEMASVSLA